jgi:hypothetical protein
MRAADIVLISHATATPTLRADQSARRAAGISRLRLIGITSNLISTTGFDQADVTVVCRI